MSTKVLFTFEAEDLGVARKQDEIADRMKAIRKEIQAAKQQGGPYQELLKESQALKREQDELRKKQRELNKEFAATKVPKDSLAGLRLEYSRLVTEINNLSAAQRKSDFGKNLISQAQAAKTQINSMEAEVGRFTGNVGNYKQSITSAILSIGAVLGGLNLGANIIQSARETEKLFAVLKNATGGEFKAAAIFKQLQEFAATTPFALNEVVGAFTKLEQRNFNPTIEQLKTIGDISAASGKSIDQFVEAILDAQTGEFERLKEFGVVARKEGDNVRVTFRGQSETFKNTAENLNEYLLKLGELPGISGATASVAGTLDGSLSNLADNFSRLFASLGSGGGFLKGIVDEFNKFLDIVNSIVDVPLSETLMEQRTEFNALIGILQDVNTSESVRKSAIQELQLEYPDYIGNINLETASQSELNKLLGDGNKLFEQRIFLQQNEEKLQEFAKQRLQTEKLLFEATKDLQQLQQSGQQSESVVRFGNVNDIGGDRPQATRGQSAEQRVTSLKQQLERLNTVQRDFVNGQTELSNAIFGSSEAANNAVESFNKAKGATDKVVTSSQPDKEKAAKGSIQFFADEVKRLQEQLEKTPVKSPTIEQLVKDLKAAEIQLRIVEQQLKDIKSPPGAAPTELDQANAGLLDLGVGISETSKNDAAAQLRALAISLAEQAGVVNLDISVDEQAARQTQAKLDKIGEDNRARDQKIADAKKDKSKQVEEELTDAAISSAQTVADSVFQIKQNELERYQAAQFEKLDAQEAKAIENANGNAAKEKQIRADFEKKRQALEKEGAEKRKALAKKEALHRSTSSLPVLLQLQGLHSWP